MINTVGPRTWARVSRENWSTPRGLVHGPESPGTASRNRGPSDMSVSRPGELVDPAGPGTHSRAAKELVETAVPPTQAGVDLHCWSTPSNLGHGPEWSGRARRFRGPSGTSASSPGHLVDPAGPCTQDRVTRDSWSTLRALAHGTESPRTAGRPCGPLDEGPSCSVQLVDTAGPRTRT